MGSDFRVGDVVCDIRYGTGTVVNVRDLGFWNVEVTFDIELGVFEAYSQRGFSDSMDKFPALRHGTWEEVFGNLPVIKPKRTKKLYLNVWLGDNDMPYCCLYDSKVGAISAKDKYMREARYKFVKVAEEIEVEE